MVGAVLVFENRIIGEGFHGYFGGPHAEVNCIRSVKLDDEKRISSSTLYVSLEPCSHYGKTPPCADLIIQKKIPHVVIGCRDPYPQVSGSGIRKLQDAGIRVETGVLEEECRELIADFYTNLLSKRARIVLKWAQSADLKIAHSNFSRLHISNQFTNRLVHKWRSEEAAIMVGTNTALFDDPLLTNRHWTGGNPVRVVLDLDLRLPLSLKLFDQSVKTIVFNTSRHEAHRNLVYYRISAGSDLIPSIASACLDLKLGSLLVEGGRTLLQSFIDAGIWDEARIITNENLIVKNGIDAPVLTLEKFLREERILNDRLRYYKNSQNT